MSFGAIIIVALCAIVLVALVVLFVVLSVLFMRTHKQIQKTRQTTIMSIDKIRTASTLISSAALLRPIITKAYQNVKQRFAPKDES